MLLNQSLTFGCSVCRCEKKEKKVELNFLINVESNQSKLRFLYAVHIDHVA